MGLGRPLPEPGRNPREGPFRLLSPSPISPAVQQGFTPLAHSPCGDARPGEGQAVPGDRSPGPAVAALPGETGAQAPPSPPSRGRQEQHAHTWPEM